MQEDTFKKIYNATLTSIRYATLSKLLDADDDVDVAERAYYKAVHDMSNVVIDLINRSPEDVDTRTIDDGCTNA